MDRFETLKEKYKTVLEMVKQHGVVLSHLHVQDDKLVMQGAAPTEDIKNAVWNQIKAVDPGYSDLLAEITVDSGLPQPKPAAQTYKVVAGDTLSKIAQHFYGDANKYMTIFQANTGTLHDPNKIQVGQELVIPAS